MLAIQVLRQLARMGTLTPELAKDEVDARHALMQQLVGQLYPSILTDEIHEIQGLSRSNEQKLVDPA